MEWQPIETAPKDGRRILLGREGWCEVGRWALDYECRQNADPGAWSDDHDYGGPEDDSWPTHWTPLPEPPKEPA